MKTSTTPSAAAHPSFLRKWGSLIVLSLGLAIIVIDTTLLNVSLKAIILDLHTDIAHLQWVISAYTLTLTALTITGGRMGDFFGRKRMFMLGAVLFAMGSFLASVSTSFGMLLSGESIIEGIGAALMMPATSSLLVANFKGRDRAVAFGIWGGVAAAAAAIGPILGGYLTTNFSWRWGFRINIVVAAILLIGSVLVKESRDEAEKPMLDIGGIVFSSIGLFLVVFGFIESTEFGWWTAAKTFSIGGLALSFGTLSIVPPSIALGLVFIALFVWWEWRREKNDKTPLVSLRLFANHQFRSGVSTMAMLSLGQSGIIFSVPVFLQAVRGLDAFHTGLALLPLSLALLVGAPLSSFVSRFITPKRLVQLGLFLNFCAMLLLSRTLSVHTTALDLAPGLALYGFGMGLMMAQISNIALSAVSVQEAGEASGVNNMLRQLGSTLGAALIGSIFLSSVAAYAADGISKSAVIPVSLKPQITSTLSQHASDFEFSGGRSQFGSLPTAVAAEITAVTNSAMASGGSTALLYTDVVVFLAFLVSMTLPNVKDVETGIEAAAVRVAH